MSASTARAQRSAGDAQLVRIDSLVNTGQLAEARVALDRWTNAHPRSDVTVSGNDRAAALVLTGRLARTWSDAETAWVAVALGYPAAPAAAEAMLRLGQGLLAQPASPTSRARAASYLERLASDYPNSPLRPLGFVWLARAYSETGRRDAACIRLRQVGAIAADSITSRLLDTERARVCATR
jgi:TolA-binding protein